MHSIQDIWNHFKQLEGSTLYIPDKDVVNRSKQGAKQYDKLYHCTNADALISIIKNKEFWLNTLKWVNDKDEKNRIDVPKFENSYYVACFTYENAIPDEHWIEYGNNENGILFSVKKEWFLKDISFMSGDNYKTDIEDFKIFPSSKITLDKKIEAQKSGKHFNPFSIFDFDFYKIIYDDDLICNIENEGSMNMQGETYVAIAQNPTIAGIVKKKKGLCERFGQKAYIKDWTSEKEIRLKIGVWQGPTTEKSFEFFYPKIAVKLDETAFDAFEIRFSPKFDIKRQEEYLDKLYELLPNSKIVVLTD